MLRTSQASTQQSAFSTLRFSNSLVIPSRARDLGFPRFRANARKKNQIPRSARDDKKEELTWGSGLAKNVH
jgi:hypothetical protein